MQWSKVRRYQRGTQKRKSKKDRQYNGLELEDTKGIIRSRKSKKERQNTAQKAKFRATRPH